MYIQTIARKSKFHLNATYQKKLYSNLTPSKTNGDLIGKVVFGSICFSTFLLGVWQAKRYSWKVDLIESSKNKLSDKPENIPKNLTNNDLILFLKDKKGKIVEIEGKFDHSRELFLGPRTAPLSSTGQAQGMSSNPQGYYLITPLIRADKSVVFINRGWIPKTTNNWDRPAKDVSIICVVSETEKKTYFAPVNNDIADKKLLWLEKEALVKATQYEIGDSDDLVIFDEISVINTSSEVKSYPIRKKVKDFSEYSVAPVTHLVYSVTWFSLCIAGSIMSYYKFRNKRFRRSKIP